MPTTNKPAPVATGTDPGLTTPTINPVGPLDTAPEPVPPGPGLGVTATIPTIVPVVTAQTETVNVAATTASSFVPNTISTNTVIRYLSVSDESIAVNGQVTNLNFVGTGVSVANTANAINSVTVTINGGGTTYGNSNVVTLLAGFGSNTLSTTGNITGGNLITSAQVVASGVVQSGTGLSTGGYLSVDGDADLHKTTVTGNLSATGNITGSYILGNGSQLTGLAATYSNSNVQAYLPTYSGNIGALTVTGNLTVTGTTSTVNTEIVNVSESVVGNVDAGNLRTVGQVTATGNITGAYFVGNGSTLSSLVAGNVTGTVANATYALTSNAATYATQATTADTANAVAGANVSGTVANATYATSAGSATTATTAGTANAVAGANVSGTVANATYALNSNAATYATQATYADTANAVAGANVSGTVANATYATSAGSATTAGTVTTAAQGNITSVGILTSLSVSGNITAANLGNIASLNLNSNASTVLYGNGTFASLPASSSYGNSDVTTLLGNLGSNVISSTGNISTTANISGGYILGNGSQLTSLPAPTVAQDITSVGAMSIMTYDGNLKYASYATIEPVSGNITGNNISATGNITANNLGNISTINLTGSSSNVLYGNGTFAPAAGGGAANTGNVTFNDVNIIGTGNLHLQPDPANTGSYLDIYLTVGPDIHIAKTDANVILGSDTSANVTVGTNGNVYIQASTGTAHTWAFDSTGNLTLPGNAFAVNYANGTAVSLAGGSGTVTNVQGDGIVSGLSLTGNVTTTGNLTLGGTLDLSSLSGNISTTGNITAANLGNIASINLDGNASNVLAGNGTWIATVAEASFSIQTANFNASTGNRYGVNTTGGAVTATLPASPATGGAVFFADAGGAYATNNLIINPNGQTIMGASGNMTVSTDNQSVGLFYNGATWRTYNAG
jgi:hypothetical protein